MMADFSSDQFNSFLDLDILGQDFCPQFDIHDDSNISVDQLSTDSPNNSDALDVDFQDELEKILSVEGSESIFCMDDHFDIDFLSSKQDDNNNNHDGEFSVKVKENSFDHFLDNTYSSVPSKQTKEESVQMECLSQKVKVAEERATTQNLVRPTEYFGHTQRKPEKTSHLTKQNPMSVLFSQSNDFLPPEIPKLNLEKRAPFPARQMVSLINDKTGQRSSNLPLHPLRSQVQGKMLNPPELKAHSQNPTLGSAITKLQSPGTSDSLFFAKFRNLKPASSKKILVKNPGGARLSKVRGGISILKPVSPTSQEPSLNITPVKAAQKHSKDARHQIMERKAMKNQTKKQRILGRLVTLPGAESQVTSPSGWVTKEDPLKEVKNQQERDRRGQLAMYREKLRKVLPQTQGVEKVATVTVLEMAREFCGQLRLQVDQLETEQQEEEEKNCLLKRMLGMLTSDQPCLPKMEVSAEEEMTIKTFFERFDFEVKM